MIMTVNGQPVKKYRLATGIVILEGADGMFWKPSSNNDYVLEFKPKGNVEYKGNIKKAIDMHLRFAGFLLM